MNATSTGISLALGLIWLAGCTTEPVVPEMPRDQLAIQYIQLGVGYMQKGNYELALVRLKRAIEVDPKSAQAHNVLGLLYENLGENEKAEQHFAQAVRLDPDLSSARNNFGGFLCRLGRTDEAEAQFQAALQNPVYARPEIAYTNAGLCMQQAGQLERAERYLRDALQKDPRIPPALLQMSQISFQTGRYLPARAYLQRYQEVGPATAESLWLGYRIENLLGDQTEASTYAMRLQEDFPDSQEVRMLQKKRAR